MSRRMFTPEIVESDSFYSLPDQCQALYLHLCMNSDDDGFINRAIRIRKDMDLPPEALDRLVEDKFVLKINDFVYCIKHWQMHNKIRSDRKKPTAYQDELNQLIVNENGSYSQKVHRTRTDCGQFADKMPRRLGKDSIGEDRLGEREGETPPPQPNPDSIILGKYSNVVLTKCERDELIQTYPDYWEDRIEKFSEYLHDSGKKYAHHFSKIMRWAKEDKVPTYSDKAEKSYDADEFFQAALAKSETRK